MADKDTSYYVVAYDITEPKCLIKINKILKSYGISMQYSVFLVPLNKKLCIQLMSELDEFLNKKNDDIRIYPLPAKPDMILLGNQQIPDGVFVDLFNK